MADLPVLLTGGGDPPLDVVGVVDASFDVGGEQGEGAGLPGPGAPAGSIGQGGAAGIVPGLPAAAANLATMAVLQQLLASNHAIAARLTCLETTQVHPHEQEPQQQQPQHTQPLQQVVRRPVELVGRRGHGMSASASAGRRNPPGCDLRVRKRYRKAGGRPMPPAGGPSVFHRSPGN